MEHVELGRSGIVVSHVALGCGNFGGVGSAPAFFGQGIPRDEAFRIMDTAWNLGITTFDTADAYGGGRGETWLAEAVEISELEGLTRYEWVQNSFSLLDQHDAEPVFAVCHEHGLGFEAFGPLAGGWLTGKYRRGEAFPTGSRMTQRPDSYLRYA